MKKSTIMQRGKTSLLIGLIGFASGAEAETVYKCMKGATLNFTSSPTTGQNCHSVELNVVRPNPEEVAREMEQKRLREEEDLKEDERVQAEKRQAATQQALKRAGSAEDALRVLRNTPATGKGVGASTWTGYYPHQGPGSAKQFTYQAPPAKKPDNAKAAQ